MNAGGVKIINRLSTSKDGSGGRGFP